MRTIEVNLYQFEQLSTEAKEKAIESGYSVKEEFIDEYDEEIEYLEDEYRKEMSEEILTWLRDEYEYLQTNESVAETLIANEYDFTEDGEIY